MKRLSVNQRAMLLAAASDEDYATVQIPHYDNVRRRTALGLVERGLGRVIYACTTGVVHDWHLQLNREGRAYAAVIRSR